LDRAVVAARREYGWLVDYEDPVYLASDLVDGRSPEFLKSHPQAKLFYRPRGEAFSHVFLVDPSTNPTSDTVRRNFVTEMVASYHDSKNPRGFEVRDTAPHRLAVIGRNANTTSPLDQTITISLNSDGYTSLESILHKLSPLIGHSVGLGIVTPGPLLRCNITKNYTNIAARAALLDVLDSCHQSVVYELLYDANRDIFLFNLDGTVTTVTDPIGRKSLKPIDLQNQSNK
jgi:hypothetical protein